MTLLLLATPGGGEAFAADKAAAPTTKPADLIWQKLADESEIVQVMLPGKAQPVDALKVTLPATGGTVRVLDLVDPKIIQATWMIEGQVKYENAKGNGYLEMWNHFPDGSAYFTRTLDTSGPMGMLHGKSDWRTFKLPFFSQRGKTPSKLEVNVVLPGGGTVWLAPATLKEGIGSAGAAPAAWWGPAQGGRIGGGFGTILGLYGATIGILASRGRGRRIAISLMVAVLIVCTLVLVIGIIAVSIGQPYEVWYPLTLSGGLGAIITGALLPVMLRRFEEAEMRRMT
ncbi:MAG: hypothetical protein QOE14_2176, partial [Humisphaera sp.]|nr:hypothetical protein [Humisphaera sp.]